MSQAEHHQFVRELFGFVPGLSLKRMFGGLGIFQDEMMFALSIEEQLYLKTDAETVSLFQARGLKPFTYEAKGKILTVAYYELDAEAFEDASVLRHWVQLALAAAVRQRGKPKTVRKRSKSKAKPDTGKR